jgi:hypothetical protein
MRQVATRALPHADSLLDLFVNPEDGSGIFLRNDFHRTTQKIGLFEPSHARERAPHKAQKSLPVKNNRQNTA